MAEPTIPQLPSPPRTGNAVLDAWAAQFTRAVSDELVRILRHFSETYTVTNLNTDRSYDADSTSVAELADVLGTLIDDLGLR